MDRNARFWNRIANRYAHSPVRDQASYEEKLRLTRNCFTADSVVLEVGCGTGSTALLHAPQVGQVIATDFADGMVAIARERAREAGIGNVTFVVADAAALEFDDGSFDVVLALNLLHLVDDLDTVLAELVRVLRSGGFLVASTACLGDSLPWLRFALPPARWLGLVPRVRFFTAGRLRARGPGPGAAL